MNLPKTGGSCFSEEPRSEDVITSTPLAADTRAGGDLDAAYSVQNRGGRGRPRAGSPVGGRWLRLPVGSVGPVGCVGA